MKDGDMEKRLTAFLFREIYAQHFTTKTEMARALNMDLRGLKRVYQKLDTAKGGTIALDRLFLYCVKAGIDPGPILRAFAVKEGFTNYPDICARVMRNITISLPEETISALNEKGVELAKSIKTIVCALQSVELIGELMQEDEMRTVIELLQHIMETAYDYVLEIYKQ